MLVARGCDVNSMLILRHTGSGTNSLIAKLAVAAGLTVKEPNKAVPILPVLYPCFHLRWRPPVRQVGAA